MKLYLIAVLALLCAFACISARAAAPPDNLTVTPEWAPDCASCHMAMPHLVLSWGAVDGAASYTVLRDGQTLQTQIPTPSYTDMAVQSGRTYSYSVFAVGADGQSGPPCAPQSGTAPLPPAGAETLPPPVNVTVSGYWFPGSADRVSWTPVPGAIAYNVYQYGKMVGGRIPRATFRVQPGVWAPGLTYTVTSVSVGGAESIPSNPVTAQGMEDPSGSPSGNSALPGAPYELVAAPEQNAGASRIRLTWKGQDSDYTYYVLRDGQRIANGVWALTYLDTNVAPGETHTYAITGANVLGSVRRQSAPSPSVKVTVPALVAASAFLPVVVVDKIVPNDDSATLVFQPVPGATDYRIYDTAHPGKFKYAGFRSRQSLPGATPLPPMPLAIEWNGVDPNKGVDLVVEAVDKLGPFQTMDGEMGPGAMTMDGMDNVSVNGQGDPSNVPNVVARSAAIHITPQPRTLPGSQAFFDTFRTEKPLVQNMHPDPRIAAWNAGEGNFAEYQNDKWTMRAYQADLTSTRLFFMGSHFMDTLYDGGTAGCNVMHNNNASVVMMPNITADISGGRVLHATFEVDAHFDSRRWCDVFVGAAGDPLLVPGKFSETNTSPTVSGNLFRWEIHNGDHDAEMFLNGKGTDVMGWTDWLQPRAVSRILWDHVSPLANGTQQELDKRHRFDLYLSQTHFRIVETTPDGKYSVVHDADLPASQTLPFTKAQVYFVHQLYHTGNDRPELVMGQPWETYWHNYRPWCDERHWDNMGQEVLNGFPAMPKFAPLPQ